MKACVVKSMNASLSIPESTKPTLENIQVGNVADLHRVYVYG